MTDEMAEEEADAETDGATHLGPHLHLVHAGGAPAVPDPILLVVVFVSVISSVSKAHFLGSLKVDLGNREIKVEGTETRVRPEGSVGSPGRMGGENERQSHLAPIL